MKNTRDWLLSVPGGGWLPREADKEDVKEKNDESRPHAVCQDDISGEECPIYQPLSLVDKASQLESLSQEREGEEYGGRQEKGENEYIHPRHTRTHITQAISPLRNNHSNEDGNASPRD